MSPVQQHHTPHRASSGNFVTQPLVLSGARLLFFGIASLPFLRAAPVSSAPFSALAEDEPDTMDLLGSRSRFGASWWGLCWVDNRTDGAGESYPTLPTFSKANVLQDEIYLQVIKTSGEGSEKSHAAKVLRLLKRGKHWVLVTLLLGNVITNETLPIVLDRSLGGGWPAVLGSTVLIGKLRQSPTGHH